jgi:hypothetical protein
MDMETPIPVENGHGGWLQHGENAKVFRLARQVAATRLKAFVLPLLGHFARYAATV